LCVLATRIDRVPDADRDTRDRRGLPAGRLRQVERRRICRRHFLDRRSCADASWIVAVLFTPYLGLKLLPNLAKPGVHENAGAIYDTRVYRALRRVIGWCLRRRKTVVAVTVLMFVGSVGGFGLVQQQFFPTSTRSELHPRRFLAAPETRP
jgi:hypothetical protein